jgi:tetratricopeptide (TPR) repeat protein
MKSRERHDLRRNELLELLSNPRELARRYGLPALIIVVAAVVAIFLIYRASGAQDRKWQQAWLPLERAVATHNEELLRAITGEPKNEALVRAWANVKRGELLYNRSQQSEDFGEKAAREELLSQAISCHNQALKIGQKWREVVGQATIGLGLCYENLGQFERAAEHYEVIISQAEERFAGTIWLGQAQIRKAFLERLEEEKIVFSP